MAQSVEAGGLELSILMPCLEEEETIGICIAKAQKTLEANAIHGEVLVADNGSTAGVIWRDRRDAGELWSSS